MADEEFKKGDTVRLKSGGPTMVVINPKLEGGLVYCTRWNGKVGKAVFESFQPYVIEATSKVDSFSTSVE